VVSIPKRNMLVHLVLLFLLQIGISFGQDFYFDNGLEESQLEQPCVVDPALPECVDFHLNETYIEKVMGGFCNAGMMSTMPTCTVRSHCVNDTRAKASPYCLHFSLYKSICLEMPRMRDCNVYNRLCNTNNSKVKECHLDVLPIPSMGVAWNLTRDICLHGMWMDGCEKCVGNDGQQRSCHLLEVYSNLCVVMPGMPECGVWARFCAIIPTWGLCDAGTVKIPRMEMYFHFTIYDYILFKEWVPQTVVSYVIAVFGTFLLAILYEGLKVFKIKMELSWRAQLRKKLQQKSTQLDDTPLMPTGEVSKRPYDFWIEIQRSMLKMLETFLHYILMLLAMTFNVGLFIAIIAGVGVGSLLFAPFAVIETNNPAKASLNNDSHC